jgi:hypothetical protein
LEIVTGWYLEVLLKHQNDDGSKKPVTGDAVFTTLFERLTKNCRPQREYVAGTMVGHIVFF